MKRNDPERINAWHRFLQGRSGLRMLGPGTWLRDIPSEEVENRLYQSNVSEGQKFLKQVVIAQEYERLCNRWRRSLVKKQKGSHYLEVNSETLALLNTARDKFGLDSYDELFHWVLEPKELELKDLQTIEDIHKNQVFGHYPERFSQWYKQLLRKLTVNGVFHIQHLIRTVYDAGWKAGFAAKEGKESNNTPAHVVEYQLAKQVLPTGNTDSAS